MLFQPKQQQKKDVNLKGYINEQEIKQVKGVPLNLMKFCLVIKYMVLITGILVSYSYSNLVKTKYHTSFFEVPRERCQLVFIVVLVVTFSDKFYFSKQSLY